MNQHSGRPETTLFMIESLDGKISTGDADELDVDLDLNGSRVLKKAFPNTISSKNKQTLSL